LRNEHPVRPAHSRPKLAMPENRRAVLAARADLTLGSSESAASVDRVRVMARPRRLMLLEHLKSQLSQEALAQMEKCTSTNSPSVPSAESLSLPSESKTQRTEAYDVLLQGLRVEQMALCCDHCRSICFNK
jgi:hypothetical protein